MIRRLAIALFALLLATGVTSNASPVSMTPPSGGNVERHHYAISARVRPLLFWIGRSGIGDAVVTRRQGPNDAAYSLLIGSDPDRAPRRINRWGYIGEEIRGGGATLIGLMTESDEDSIEQAEASIRKQAGDRTFKVMRATIDGDQARSVVTSLAAPASYSFREVHQVLDLAQREPAEGRTRVIHLPSGTRPGFLAALADVMHAHADEWRATGRVRPGGAVSYVYHGRIYDLTVSHAQLLASLRVGGAVYTHVIASDFEIRDTHDGSLTRFSMTYGVEGQLAEIPLAASFQPRWWLQIDLVLDDTAGEPALADGPHP